MSNGNHNGPRFNPGQVVLTVGVFALLKSNVFDLMDVTDCLFRHIGGDWGNVPAEDARENELAVEHGLRILSSYELNEVRIWIITEWDRSVTTILLPEEY